MAPGRLAETSQRSRWLAVLVVVWALLGIVFLVAAGTWLLLQVRVIFPPLVLAVALIVVLNPTVTWLQSHRVPRVVGTMLTYAVLFGGLTLIVSLIAPIISRQVQGLIDNWPEIQARAIAQAEGLADRYNVEFDQQSVNELVRSAQAQAGAALRRVTEFTTDAIHVLLIFVLAPFLALYLLIDLPRLRDSFVAHLPPARRDEWLHLAARCGQAVSAFFRGQLLVALIVAVLSTILLSIARVPFAVPIGLIAGLTNIIPFVGPFIGGGIAVVVGAITGGADKALLAALAMLAVQQLDNHLISPNVMGRAVKLHPVTIILALLGGGTLAGIFGMLLSVPTVAVTKILVLHYYSRHVLGLPAGAPTAAAPAAAAPVAAPAADAPEPVAADASAGAAER